MRRREFITLLGSAAAAWPLAARAQQGERVRRIGVLMRTFAAEHPQGQVCIAAFLQALAQLGWTTGRNMQIDTRWATANKPLKFADTRRNWSRSCPTERASRRPVQPEDPHGLSRFRGVMV